MVPALGPKCSTCNRRRRSIIAVDIASFFVAVAVGQWTSYRLISSSGRLPPLWVSVAGTMPVISFAVLTFAPPHIPLFQEASTGTYGRT